MNTDDLDAAVRDGVFMPDAASNPQYSQAKVLNELNDKLQTVFEDAVLDARAGYWLHEFIYTTIANDSDYRIPPRACVQGLEKVEFATSLTGPWTALDEIPVSTAQDYRGSISGTPLVYTFFGDVVDVIPTPQAGAFVKMTYYIRPSRLVPQQSSTNNGGTVRGQITAVNTGTRVVTVNALPFDQSLAVPAAITSGQQRIDIVHPDGWHELSLVGAPQTFSGLNITVGGTDDMGDILVGDYVRVADQTDWPCLPDDFHRCLADTVAVKIMLQLGMQSKSDALAVNNGNDILRFKSMITPRSRSQPKQIPIVRRSRGTTGFPYGWRFT